jgi:hypothetical protein
MWADETTGAGSIPSTYSSTNSSKDNNPGGRYQGKPSIKDIFLGHMDGCEDVDIDKRVKNTGSQAKVGITTREGIANGKGFAASAHHHEQRRSGAEHGPSRIRHMARHVHDNTRSFGHNVNQGIAKLNTNDRNYSDTEPSDTQENVKHGEERGGHTTNPPQDEPPGKETSRQLLVVVFLAAQFQEYPRVVRAGITAKGPANRTTE